MGKGLSGVRQVSAAQQARRGSAGPGAGTLFFRLKANEEAVVRFLEQDDDVHWAMMHEVPVEGRSWGVDVPCLNQEDDGTACPGCDRDLKRAFKGYINLIWFGAPVYQRDGDNKIVKGPNGPVVIGTKPQVAVWNSGIRLFEDLDEINANYKGLSSRRFKVKRKGSGLDTKYVIVPENPDEGRQDFAQEEVALREGKYDLNPFITPPSHDEWMKRLGEQPTSGGQAQDQALAQAQSPGNPFAFIKQS